MDKPVISCLDSLNFSKSFWALKTTSLISLNSFVFLSWTILNIFFSASSIISFTSPSEVYDTFRKQLEYVCGISHEGIYSDIYNRLRSNPNLPLEEKEDLKRQRPVISIHEDETLFYEDYAANHMPSIVLERGKSKYNWDFLNKQKPTEILM